MNKLIDVLGAGIAAVDDLIYVSDFPPVDCKIPVHGSTRQGGGPACTAIAAAGMLGGRAAFAARFGDDELSKYIASALDRRGVDISHIVHDPAGGPYHSIIVVDGSGHRNVFYDPALYRVVTANDLPDALIQSATLVLLDHITEPSLIAVAEKVRILGVPILGDIEGRSESAMNLAALTDYLVVPKAFAAWASGAPDPRDACAFLAGTQRLATVVTDGAEGCYFNTKTDPEVRHFPAFKVDAFDTNGCGDTFHGAFALAAARNLGVGEAIAFASAAAALKATAAGGKRRGWNALPTFDEVFQFLQATLREPERSSLLEKLGSLRRGSSVTGKL
ncbi:MAG: PfkB family carbohydrate kinase [Terriglobia bacterium]|nr:PfkB family carbohydrate kinase [Terriglobia bacterium]